MKAILALIISLVLTAACDAQTASEWQQQAVKEFPDLAVKDSSLNKLYVAEYNRLKGSTPDFFSDVQWPLLLARQCNTKLQNKSAIPGIPSIVEPLANQREAAIQQVLDRLDKIIIPGIQTEDQPLRDVLTYLTFKTKELDAAGIGIPIRIDPSAGQAADQNITLALRNIPTKELLRYIADIAKLRVRVDVDGVTLMPKDN